MDILNIFLISVALAMDAFAVSLAVGVSLKDVKLRQAVRLAWHFGFFQAMMPVIGWFLGKSVFSYVETYGSWIAFVLLAGIGINMIREAFSSDDEDDFKNKKDPTKGFSLVFLSTATSIDALAAGFSLSVMNLSIVFPAVVIGITALVFTFTGIYTGKKIAIVKKAGHFAEVFGGIILLALAVKTVL